MGIEAVLIDSREADWVKALTFGCSSVAVAMLDTADLWLTCSDGALVLVERKTTSDLLNTLRDDRLFPQLQAMRERSAWSYLAICGTLYPGPAGKCYADGRESGWNWASVQGALLTAQEIGIHVLHVATDLDYEPAVIRLGNRERSPLRVAPAREIGMLSEAEIVLTSLPGIGEQTATKLVEYCGSAANALWALTLEEGPQIPGVGSGIKRKVRRALGLEDGLSLIPMPPDPLEKMERKGAA